MTTRHTTPGGNRKKNAHDELQWWLHNEVAADPSLLTMTPNQQILALKPKLQRDFRNYMSISPCGEFMLVVIQDIGAIRVRIESREQAIRHPEPVSEPAADEAAA